MMIIEGYSNGLINRFGTQKLNDLWNLTRTFNYTALILAAKESYKEIVELLIRQEGININIQSILKQKH